MGDDDLLGGGHHTSVKATTSSVNHPSDFGIDLMGGGIHNFGGEALLNNTNKPANSGTPKEAFDDLMGFSMGGSINSKPLPGSNSHYSTSSQVRPAPSTSFGDDFDLLGGTSHPIHTQTQSVNIPVPNSQSNTPQQSSAVDDFEFEDFQAPVPSALTVNAFRDDCVDVKFVCRKDASPSRTLINITFDNLSSTQLSSIDIKVGPAKHIQLNSFNPLSIASLNAGARNVHTHSMDVTNTLQGQKAIAFRVQVSYTVSGVVQNRDTVVNGFSSTY